MNNPPLARILRVHESAHFPIDDPIDDCWLAAALRLQMRRADVVGQHRAAHEGALDCSVLALHLKAKLSPHYAAGAIDTEHVSRRDLVARAGLYVLDLRQNHVWFFFETDQTMAETYV